MTATTLQGLGRSHPPEQGLSATEKQLIVLYPAGSIENWQATGINVFLSLTGSFLTYSISGYPLPRLIDCVSECT